MQPIKATPENQHKPGAVVTQKGNHARRHKSNYELFNRSNDDIRHESWNYRGCWHQTCPLIDPR